jgi:hypothetical protein
MNNVSEIRNPTTEELMAMHEDFIKEWEQSKGTCTTCIYYKIPEIFTPKNIFDFGTCEMDCILFEDKVRKIRDVECKMYQYKSSTADESRKIIEKLKKEGNRYEK